MERKITKTQKKICNAMKSLLKEKDYDDITIQELVNKAEVSRSSFYNHFEKKDDVMKMVISMLGERIAAKDMFEKDHEYDKQAITRIRERVVDYSKEHRDDIVLIYKAGFGAEYSRIVRTKLLEVRAMFAYEFEDEDGNRDVYSDGILYDLKTWSSVNDTMSSLELYYEKYSDMPTDEYTRMIEKAGHMHMTGNFYKKETVAE